MSTNEPETNKEAPYLAKPEDHVNKPWLFTTYFPGTAPPNPDAGRTRKTVPDKPGWWWIKCAEGEFEPVEVVHHAVGLRVQVLELGTTRKVYVEVGNFNWLGPVNPEPLPMPFEDG